AGIETAGHGPPPRTPDEEVAGVIAPGLCDLQVNGAGGREATGDDDALDAIEGVLTARGVMRFLAATSTAPDEQAPPAVRPRPPSSAPRPRAPGWSPTCSTPWPRCITARLARQEPRSWTTASRSA